MEDENVTLPLTDIKPVRKASYRQNCKILKMVKNGDVFRKYSISYSERLREKLCFRTELESMEISFKIQYLIQNIAL